MDWWSFSVSSKTADLKVKMNQIYRSVLRFKICWLLLTVTSTRKTDILLNNRKSPKSVIKAQWQLSVNKKYIYRRLMDVRKIFLFLLIFIMIAFTINYKYLLSTLTSNFIFASLMILWHLIVVLWTQKHTRTSSNDQI